MLPCMYSALIPAQTLSPPRINSTTYPRQVGENPGKRSEVFLSKIWTYGSRQIRVVLKKQQWNDLLKYFEVPAGLSLATAQSLRTKANTAPERKGYLERTLFTMTPESRVCMMKFRADGILLPFGASRQEFDKLRLEFCRALHTVLRKESHGCR